MQNNTSKREQNSVVPAGCSETYYLLRQIGENGTPLRYMYIFAILFLAL